MLVGWGLLAAIGGCASKDNSCPADLPATGGACSVPPNQSSVPGAVPECNYVTETNECGAAFCVCTKEAWVCGATCGFVDASLPDQYVVDAPSHDSAGVDSSVADGADGAPMDATAVDGFVTDGPGVDAGGGQ
ncbi:MAG TPA: hypothetical protein VGG39_02435 [Polyangiaceae bacterium]|jgi:hypothetical protein